MKKVLFIIPPNKSYETYTAPSFNESHYEKRNSKGEKIYVTDLVTDMPLGVLSISSYIKKMCADVIVELIDFNVISQENELLTESWEELFVREFDSYRKNKEVLPDFIGVSALFITQFNSMLALGRILKKYFSESIILAGGHIPTTMYEEIYIREGKFDALCFGEGEIPWAELINAKECQKYMRNSKSWITKEKIETNCVYEHKYIQNLDEIPFLDYDLCNPARYGIALSARRFGTDEETIGQMPNFHFMSSRGCPNHCCFCASHAVHGRSMRYYSIERVREDLKKLKERYHAKNIIIQDDHFMADKNRAYQTIEILHDLHMVPIFQNALAMYALDYDFLKKLREYNITSLVLPIESGSERVLKEIMHKPLNQKIIRRVAEDCRKLNIYTNANILIGLPGETKKDMEDAIDFLKEIPVNWYNIHIASPLVGSEMHEICVEKNYLTEEAERSIYDCDFSTACVSTEDFTAEYIKEKSYDMNLELNFVYNSDYRMGNYEEALQRFCQIIRLAGEHFLACYMAAKCLEKLGNTKESRQYMDKAMEIVEKNERQKSIYTKFRKKLPI